MNDTSAGRAVIEAATATWMDAFNNGDAATIAGTMSPDAQIMPPNGNLVEGREAIQAFWQGFIDSGVKCTLTAIEIEVEGDMGYKIGTFRILDPAGAELDHGKFIEVWRCFDGEWLFHRDIWNSSVPLPEDD